MDKLFTGNYDNDDENQTEKDEISELLDILNGMKSEDEQLLDVEETVEATEDVIMSLSTEAEDDYVDENIQYSNILEEFEDLEKQEEKNQKKEKVKFLDKIKAMFFQVVNQEEEEANENERILKELEKVTQKSEKKVKALKDKEARKEARKNRNVARAQFLEKLKRPKKLQTPKEPEEKIRVTPIFIAFMLTLVAGIVITILTGTNAYTYNFSFNSAKDNFFNQKYELAYEKIAGLTPRKEDETIYSQILTIMYVEKQYLSYENYMDLGMELEALNSLIKGIKRYDDYKSEAESLGISSDMEFVFSNITIALSEDFELTENDARNLNYVTDSTEYTKELYSLLGYK
ncbi:MAG: hypothetical protein GX913_07505 [Clostridiales bacterium]|nr:hypothetical protein [Clostridiales bacterium]